MSMTKTGVVVGKAKKIETEEELEEFEKRAQSIRGDMKKQADRVKRDATRTN